MLLSFITKNQINQAEGIRKQSPMYPVLAAAQLGIVLDHKLSACIAFKSNILEVPFWLRFLQWAWLWHEPALTNFLCKLSFSFHKVIVRIEGIYMQEVLGNWGTEPAPSTRKACHTERRESFPLFASFLLQYQHILFTPQLLSLHTHKHINILKFPLFHVFCKKRGSLNRHRQSKHACLPAQGTNQLLCASWKFNLFISAGCPGLPLC